MTYMGASAEQVAEQATKLCGLLGEAASADASNLTNMRRSRLIEASSVALTFKAWIRAVQSDAAGDVVTGSIPARKLHEGTAKLVTRANKLANEVARL
jgi:hypothetical protein